jgi:predicted nucleic acid-binding protein
VKVVLDTSVLVAGTVVRHAHEERARVWLRAARDRSCEAMATTHAFAETWATLTAIPVEPRIGLAAAERIVDRLARHIQPVTLEWDDYCLALERCGERGSRSGAIYDALHLIAAERQGADVFLTFNTRDFNVLARENGPRILAPPDPPGLLEP